MNLTSKIIFYFAQSLFFREERSAMKLKHISESRYGHRSATRLVHAVKLCRCIQLWHTCWERTFYFICFTLKQMKKLKSKPILLTITCSVYLELQATDMFRFKGMIKLQHVFFRGVTVGWTIFGWEQRDKIDGRPSPVPPVTFLGGSHSEDNFILVTIPAWIKAATTPSTSALQYLISQFS